MRMAIYTLEVPPENTASAELQRKIGRSFAERALRSEAKLNWAQYLLLVNAIVFLLAVAFVSLIPRPDRADKSIDA